jgi:hypothetical protein
MTKSTAALVVALGLSLGLAACQTATPYQPLARGSRVSGGFTDQRLDADHFRVGFAGNSLTSRATVESYMLYRSAELTVAQGYDWFETVDRHVRGEGETLVDPYWGPGYGRGYFRPYWMVYGPRAGWAPWGPEFDVHQVVRYQAFTDIALHHGSKPAGDLHALDAREVIANLGPKIQHPKS